MFITITCKMVKCHAVGKKARNLDSVVSVFKVYALTNISVQFISVTQLCLTFVTLKTAAHQASLSITNSRSLLKLMSIELVMQSNHTSFLVPFSSCLQFFPASESFPMNQLFTSGEQSIGVSASASVLPMNIQDRFPLRWTGWNSLQSQELSRVFSNTTVQKYQFFSALLSL